MRIQESIHIKLCDKQYDRVVHSKFQHGQKKTHTVMRKVGGRISLSKF
jgi:hypothetical protein